MRPPVTPVPVDFARKVYGYHEAAPTLHLKLPTKTVEYYMGWPIRVAGDDLIDDIRKNGILTPVLIHTNGISGYLADGHHRLAVAQRLDITEMPVQVVPDRIKFFPPLGLKNVEHLLRSWIANQEWHVGHIPTRTPIRKGYLVRCSCDAYWREDK